MDMEVSRRSLLAMALAAASVGSTGAAAAAYPERPIRFILSHPPGGSADVMARIMQPRLEKLLGQPIVIENRSGAGGLIAMDLIAKSPPDGYTMGLGAAGALATSVALGDPMNYDPLKDLAPIVGVSGQPFILAAASSFPGKTVRDVIELDKRGTPKLSIGHGGAIMLLTAALFNRSAGVDIGLVTYRGTGPVVTDLLGAHIPLGIVDVPSAQAAIAEGKLKAIAISSAQRFPGLPDVPTFAEAGLPGFEALGWLGVVVAGGTPPDVSATLNRAFATVLNDPEVLARMASFGSTSLPTDQRQFGTFIASEIKKWTAVVEASGLKTR
jgi:tripartite-type tricarboxylate transporter receptor subunit TctC